MLISDQMEWFSAKDGALPRRHGKKTAGWILVIGQFEGSDKKVMYCSVRFNIREDGTHFWSSANGKEVSRPILWSYYPIIRAEDDIPTSIDRHRKLSESAGWMIE